MNGNNEWIKVDFDNLPPHEGRVWFVLRENAATGYPFLGNFFYKTVNKELDHALEKARELQLKNYPDSPEGLSEYFLEIVKPIVEEHEKYETKVPVFESDFGFECSVQDTAYWLPVNEANYPMLPEELREAKK